MSANDEIENYWTERYKNQSTGWDIGYVSTPLKEYFDQLTDKDLSILIPGAGNGYEAEYLHQNGFTNVHVADISQVPLATFQKRNPDFPKDHLIRDDFFDLEGSFDLIIEQTFFCSFLPLQETRKNYAAKINSLLKIKGKLVGLWFDFPLTGDLEKRPFGGSVDEYLSYFEPIFDVKIFEPCHNSIKPRQGIELFGIFCKKEKRISRLSLTT